MLEIMRRDEDSRIEKHSLAYLTRKRNMKHGMPSNTVVCGNALRELQKISSASVNLLYLDPPFFTKRDFEVLTHRGESLSFSDKWELGLQDYIRQISAILIEGKRILKKTGSLYLHCDWHAVHYLKVELDRIFGYGNFRNEIIWRRHNAHNDTRQGSKHFGRIHDSILFYSKSDDYTWNPIFQPYAKEYVEKYYKHRELDGRRYAQGDLSGPGGRAKGNPYYEFLGIERYWRYSRANMEKLYKEGRIIQSRPGTVPKLKRYLDEMSGIVLQDVWDDIGSVQVKKQENTGYPTQKPLKLLERIIEVSSNPGDIVVDPFCGSGTTLVASARMERRFIGIDVNPAACRISIERLNRLVREKDLPLCIVSAKVKRQAKN